MARSAPILRETISMPGVHAICASAITTHLSDSRSTTPLAISLCCQRRPTRIRKSEDRWYRTSPSPLRLEPLVLPSDLPCEIAGGMMDQELFGTGDDEAME